MAVHAPAPKAGVEESTTAKLFWVRNDNVQRAKNAFLLHGADSRLQQFALHDSLLRLLGEDVMVELMASLVRVRPKARGAAQATVDVRLAGHAALALWSSCHWMREISKGCAIALRREVLCMTAVANLPVAWEPEFPFCAQFHLEQQCRQQLRKFDTACNYFVTHCASAHCVKPRSGFNRISCAQEKPGTVRVAYAECQLLATARAAQVAVVYTRQRPAHGSNESVFVVCRGEPTLLDRLAWRSESELAIVRKMPAPDNVVTISVSPDGKRMLALAYINDDDQFFQPKITFLYVDLETGRERRYTHIRQPNITLSVLNLWMHDESLPEALFSVYYEQANLPPVEVPNDHNLLTYSETHSYLATYRADEQDDDRIVLWRIFHEELCGQPIRWVDVSEDGQFAAVHRTAHGQQVQIAGWSTALVCTSVRNVIDPRENSIIVEPQRHTMTARFTPGKQSDLVLIGVIPATTHQGTHDVHFHNGCLQVCYYTMVSEHHWTLSNVITHAAAPSNDVPYDAMYWRQAGRPQSRHCCSATISPCGRYLIVLLRYQLAHGHECKDVFVDLQGAHAISNASILFRDRRSEFGVRQIGWSAGCMWLGTHRGVLHLSNST